MEIISFRSSKKNAVMKNFAKVAGKHLRWARSLSEKFQAFPLTLIKKRLHDRYFPVKIFQNSYSVEILWSVASVCLNCNDSYFDSSLEPRENVTDSTSHWYQIIAQILIEATPSTWALCIVLTRVASKFLLNLKNFTSQ